MMGFLRALIGFVLAIILTVFAVFNRHSVSIFPDISYSHIEMPLYGVVLGAMGFGFLFGGFFVWLNDLSVRRDRRKQRKEIKGLQKELDVVKAGNALAGSPAQELFPVLPSKKGA